MLVNSFCRKLNVKSIKLFLSKCLTHCVFLVLCALLCMVGDFSCFWLLAAAAAATSAIYAFVVHDIILPLVPAWFIVYCHHMGDSKCEIYFNRVLSTYTRTIKSFLFYRIFHNFSSIYFVPVIWTCIFLCTIPPDFL